jgi:hypothetical protein
MLWCPIATSIVSPAAGAINDSKNAVPNNDNLMRMEVLLVLSAVRDDLLLPAEYLWKKKKVRAIPA